MQLNTANFSVPAEGGETFLDPQKIVGDLSIASGMRIADFGSGAGHFTILLATAVGETGLVTAIDLMDSALETLKAKVKNDGLNNVETVRSNLETVGGSSLPSDSQDMVLLANTLFQNQQKDVIIEEAKRVLKLDGSLVIIDWRKGAFGFGPPNELRMSPEEMQALVMGKELQFVRKVDAGTFHYGLIFKKV